jgi:hypothetical protein
VKLGEDDEDADDVVERNRADVGKIRPRETGANLTAPTMWADATLLLLIFSLLVGMKCFGLKRSRSPGKFEANLGVCLTSS